VEAMGKEKMYNSSHVYYQDKGWSKRVKKTFSMTLERVFEMVWWRGKKMESHQKEFLKLNYFSPIKILTSPFIWRDYWSFPFLHAPSFEDSGVLMIFEEKITSSKTSFQMASIY
jgi:hypothetical protein